MHSFGNQHVSVQKSRPDYLDLFRRVFVLNFEIHFASFILISVLHIHCTDYVIIFITTIYHTALLTITLVWLSHSTIVFADHINLFPASIPALCLLQARMVWWVWTTFFSWTAQFPAELEFGFCRGISPFCGIFVNWAKRVIELLRNGAAWWDQQQKKTRKVAINDALPLEVVRISQSFHTFTETYLLVFLQSFWASQQETAVYWPDTFPVAQTAVGSDRIAVTFTFARRRRSENVPYEKCKFLATRFHSCLGQSGPSLEMS